MKALVVEDENFTREALSEILIKEFDFDEVVQAEDGEQAWELYQQQAFNFIVIDLILPKLDGLKLADRILEVGLGQRILALSGECDDFTVRQVTRSGILGFIYKKEMSREILEEAFRHVFAGRVYYSKTAKDVLKRMQHDSDAYYRLLSDRELEVLRCIAQQKSDDEIGTTLNLSKFTVRRHRQSAMKKLNLKNESSIIHFALEKGIIKHRGGLDWSG
jgi:DNA-binding NarL/FixJ family response regulator